MFWSYINNITSLSYTDLTCLKMCWFPVMWSRDRGLGLETVSRPKKSGLGLGLGLDCTGLGLGLGLEGCGLGLGLKGVVLVLGVWSRSFAFGLGLAPLVGTRVEYLLNVVDISGYFLVFSYFLSETTTKR